MASYLRSWLAAPLTTATPVPEDPDSPTTPTNAPSFSLTEPNDGDNASEEDNDEVPAFPAVNSAQRIASNPSSVSSMLTTSSLMPPPAIPPPRRPGAPAPSSSSLMLPPSTTKAPPSAKSRKVALAPGHSPLDWAALKTSGADLRGGASTLARITPSVLKTHNKRDDAWSAFNGKVYNITPYLPFHPGGERELMRVAGRDGTSLFARTHGWVNVDFMMDACLVGFLVPEPSS
ncbi:cytochrome b5 [Artomyces pyxidatus]|uniref:Cytochrome b5 n=1 Tax=Artomyces pyxidatus TaxID=48021 RepID=A0ACB8TFZ2_9AGAM|nr:cytochrome b5 [Artomyces pyxidatus]